LGIYFVYSQGSSYEEIIVPRRIDDWMRQADKDLKHARTSLAAGDYEWACFASQQAAEKALKALYQSLGGESFGHSILKNDEGTTCGYKSNKGTFEKSC
jgi:hypothetical protein